MDLFDLSVYYLLVHILNTGNLYSTVIRMYCLNTFFPTSYIHVFILKIVCDTAQMIFSAKGNGQALSLTHGFKGNVHCTINLHMVCNEHPPII